MSDLASKEGCRYLPSDVPVLYRFTYEFKQRIVQSVPFTGEVETVGHQQAIAYYDVVATSKGYAAEAYKIAYGSSIERGEHTTISGPEFICYVDAIVSTAKMYGGHFS